MNKVTLWNGTNGYDFTTINYDESEPSGNVEFAGNGNFEEGATVWGIYPKKDVPTSGMFSLLRWEMLRKVPQKQSCRIRAHAC